MYKRGAMRTAGPTVAMNAAHPVVRVYLVEDSPILTKLLVGLIEAEPGAVVVGHSDTAVAAITDIRTLKPDAIVLDLHLREGSGVDVMRALRQAGDALLPHLIVLTNHSGLPYRKAAREAGAHHFFDKSSEIPLMLSLIRSLLGAAKPAG
jgi:two-component system OmpR family response regulator